MQDKFPVSASNERIDSTDSSSTSVGLVYKYMSRAGHNDFS
jgi:hypothetical protein